MLHFILILIFVSTTLLLYVVFNLFFAKRNAVLGRIYSQTRDVEHVEKEKEPEEPEYFEPDTDTVIQKLGKTLFRKKYLEKKRIKMAQAAILMRPEEFIMIKILLGLVFCALFFISSGMFLVGVVGFVIGFVIPELFINIMKNKRLTKLDNQLPEALSILANGLRAGYSFSQALDIASRELDDPIAAEFKKALRDNTFGKPIEKGMAEIVDRTGNEDIGLFVTAFTIQRQVGGNMAEMLDQITETLRERIRIKGEVKILTAQGRFSAFIVSLLPLLIALAIFGLNPDYIGVLFTNTLGQIMLAGAVLMEIVGMILIKNIIKIKI